MFKINFLKKINNLNSIYNCDKITIAKTSLLSIPIIDTFTNSNEVKQLKQNDEYSLHKKIEDLCYTNDDTLQYSEIHESIDSDDISCKYFKYLDANGIIRKIERKTSQGLLTEQKIYNNKGFLTHASEIFITPDDKIAIYNYKYNGSENEDIIDSQKITFSRKTLQ